MTELKDIFIAEWNSNNVDTPDIVDGPDYNPDTFKRVVHITPYRKTEDYMGIIERAYYTPGSEDAYNVIVGSSVSKTDIQAIIDECRRICASYSSGDDKFLLWEGGEYTLYSPWRYEFEFIVFKRKSGVTIPNAI